MTEGQTFGTFLVIITQRYLATNAHRRVLADNIRICQKTVSDDIDELDGSDLSGNSEKVPEPQTSPTARGRRMALMGSFEVILSIVVKRSMKAWWPLSGHYIEDGTLL